MKKSKHIQLVLITAALASCNRTIIPQQQPEDILADSTLTAPVDNDSMYVDNYNGCTCEDFYPGMAYAPTTYGTYYVGPGYDGYYYTGRRYGRAPIWRGGKYVVRGGFGKTAAPAGS